jgi:hypothetical protein
MFWRSLSVLKAIAFSCGKDSRQLLSSFYELLELHFLHERHTSSLYEYLYKLPNELQPVLVVIIYQATTTIGMSVLRCTYKQCTDNQH